MTRQTHWAPASAGTAAAPQSFIQAAAHSPLIHSYPEPRASRLLATSLGAPPQRHFRQEGRGPQLRCWKAQGPLGSHTCQTRKPGAKPTRSREIGRLDPRLSKGSRQHLRSLGRAARLRRTGRCASRAQGAANAGRGWEASSRPGGAVRRGRSAAPEAGGPQPARGTRAEAQCVPSPHSHASRAAPSRRRPSPREPVGRRGRVEGEAWGGHRPARVPPWLSGGPGSPSLPPRQRCGGENLGLSLQGAPGASALLTPSPRRDQWVREAGGGGARGRAGGLRPGGRGCAARGRRHRRGHRPARGCLLSARWRALGVGWARAPPPPRFTLAPSRRLLASSRRPPAPPAGRRRAPATARPPALSARSSGRPDPFIPSRRGSDSRAEPVQAPAGDPAWPPSTPPLPGSPAREARMGTNRSGRPGRRLHEFTVPLRTEGPADRPRSVWRRASGWRARRARKAGDRTEPGPFEEEPIAGLLSTGEALGLALLLDEG